MSPCIGTVFVVFAILCTSVAAYTEAATTQAVFEDYVVNEDYEQDPTPPLWRFEAGVESTGLINVGDESICLYTWRDTFVRTPPDGSLVRNDVKWCRGHERIVVEPLDDNLFAMQSWQFGRYFKCNSDGTLGQSASVTDEAKFALYFDYQAEHFGMYNPTHKRWIVAEPDGRMNCNRAHLREWERFFGWKSGTKAAWSSADRWEEVGAYDNRQSSEAHEFDVTVSIGYTKVVTPTAGLYVDTDLVVPGSEMPDVFIAGIQTTTNTDWSNVSPQTWEPAAEQTISATAEPNSYATVYQAVGQYGVFTFDTDHIDTVQSA